jgi:hypothetical protein
VERIQGVPRLKGAGGRHGRAERVRERMDDKWEARLEAKK